MGGDATASTLLARARLADALCRTGARDAAAFRVVYALTSAKLFGICVRVCGDRTAAEDVLHDVYITVWNRAGGWQPERSSPITWLATIARNRAIDWRRAQTRKVTAPMDEAWSIADPAPCPETATLAADEARRLHECLALLRPVEAHAVSEAFFSGLTYRELADRENVPIDTMKSHIRRGLAQLKRHLDDP